MDIRKRDQRRVASIAVACALLLAACGNSSPIGTAATESEDSNQSPSTTAAASVETGDTVVATDGDGSNDEDAKQLPPAGDGDTGEVTLEGYIFSEYGPVDVSTLVGGLDSCARVDPAPYSELLGLELVVDDNKILANGEPSAPDRTCILYSAENPDVDLVRINALDDASTWVRWTLHNSQLDDADIGFFQASNDSAVTRFADNGDFGYATLEVEGSGARLVVEARRWDSGIEYTPVGISTVAAMSSVAATQLASPGPGPATSVLASCADLDKETWGELIGGGLDPFVGATFNGALTCTSEDSDGNRVQVLVAEMPSNEAALTRTGLLRSAYEASLRQPDRLTLDRVGSAWEIDRIYDSNPSGSQQAVLQEAFGNEAGIFARVSVRQDTRGQRAPIDLLGRALIASLNGEPFEPGESEEIEDSDEDGPAFRLPKVDAAEQFTATGATIEVAPLTRGLATCDDLDLTAFETITGKDLSAVERIVDASLNPSVESPATEDTGISASTGAVDEYSFVECSLVRADDTSIVEMRVSASTNAAGVQSWKNADLITGLSAIDGIDDIAFWNEGNGNTGDNATSTGAGLVLYVEEGEARLLVELVKYESTPDIDVFWVAQAFAKVLFAPEG